MTDRMRILELCLKESAFAFDWLAKGNCMSCSRGYLSFMLFVNAEEKGIAFQLTYRYSAFDRIYHELTSANLFPGTRIIESVQPVAAWSLMGVSADMRRLAEKIDKVADELSNRIVTPQNNLTFLRSFKKHNPSATIKNEEMLSALAMGDNAAALALANDCLLSGDYGDGLCTRVSDYLKYRT